MAAGASIAEQGLSARKFLWTFGGTLAALAILVCAAVTATDPSRYFFGSPVPQIWPNTPATKIELFRKYSMQKKVTGLLFGSSRCALLSPEQADRFTGLRFFNGSVYNGSTDHYLALYRAFRKIQGAPPKMLVLGMDTMLLSSGADVAEDLTANYLLSSELDEQLTVPWHFTKLYAHYFRMQTFFDLRTSIQNWRSPKPPLDRYFPDGHIEAAKRLGDGASYHPTIQDMEPILVKYREFTAISEERVERLRALLQEASADGVQMLVWITPMHPALRAAIDHLQTVPAVEQRARQRIEDMAAQVHAQVVDLSSPESFGGDPSTWLDTVHISQVDAGREVNQLLGPHQN
jgi:hypothetical protein